MADIKLIGLPAQDTPPDLQTGAGHRRQIPADLLRQASRRLETLALVGAALWILGPAFGHLALALTEPDNPRWAQFGATETIATAGFVISLLVFAFSRSRECNPKLVMDIGLAYMVACAACIGAMIHWDLATGAPRGTDPMITWTPAVILIFAALLPAPPWKMAVAGFIAASMDPLGMITAQAAGEYHFGPLRNAFLMHYPNYLLLGVAVVISHVVTRLGRQVARARELGSYQLGELLGRGGMGEVYTATHRMFARTAAIKLIRPEMIGALDSARADLAVKRFRREAEAAANLRSPHTVELYDFGIAEDRTLYFVMELLDGLDLETLVQQFGPVPAERAVYILVQACASLAEAHARGLVHRDIKPANIHLGRMGLEHDFVKVLDFGLVKSVTGNVGESRETAAGVAPG